MNTQQRRQKAHRAGLSPARGAPRAKQLYFAVRPPRREDTPAPTTTRRALTLIELLIVIVILGVVTVATIPIVLPALDSRRIRESARLLSTQLAAAQMLAISTGRPAGLLIERLPGDNSGAMDLHLCEVPRPFNGVAVDSVINVQVYPGSPAQQPGVRVTPGGSPQTVDRWECSLTLSSTDNTSGQMLLRLGDVVQLGYRGPLYRVINNPPITTQGGGIGSLPIIYIEPADETDIIYDYTNYPTTPRTKVTGTFRCLPPLAKVLAYSSNPFTTPAGWFIPYQFLRRPATTGVFAGKSASQVVQLPAGTVVDLRYSGVGTTGQFTPATSGQPLVVMFSPTGALESVYFLGDALLPVDGPVHLLVGKREKLTGTAGNVGDRNLYDLESIWVSVNPQTGLTTSAEMAVIPSVNYDNRNAIIFNSNHIGPARQFATSAQGMGGR